MNFARRSTPDLRVSIVALATAGALWGLTVPLSKLGLEWLGAAWLAFARFAIAAPLLALLARRRLREALTPRIAAAGAVGYGAVILLQNAGIERTSVSHAALIVGAVPVIVAILAALTGHGSAGPAAWVGSLVALAGVGLVAGAGGAGTSVVGDGLVLLSVSGAAALIVLQPALLENRDAAAVTAVQLGAGALLALPVALLVEGAPPAPPAVAPVAGVLGLALFGTLVAFSLFAWAQARVSAQLAGAFVNLEPLVGTLAGAVVFHDAFGPVQAAGGAAILAGIALGALSRPSPGRPVDAPEATHRGARVRGRHGTSQPARPARRASRTRSADRAGGRAAVARRSRAAARGGR